MTRAVEQCRADLASLRRVAQQLRADRHLTEAMQLEKIVNEREVELLDVAARESEQRTIDGLRLLAPRVRENGNPDKAADMERLASECEAALAARPPVDREAPARTPRTTDDYEIHANVGPRHYSTRGPSPNVGYRVYLSTCEISEGGLIAFSTDKADVLADLDLLIERVLEARRRVEELP